MKFVSQLIAVTLIVALWGGESLDIRSRPVDSPASSMLFGGVAIGSSQLVLSSPTAPLPVSDPIEAALVESQIEDEEETSNRSESSIGSPFCLPKSEARPSLAIQAHSSTTILTRLDLRVSPILRC